MYILVSKYYMNMYMITLYRYMYLQLTCYSEGPETPHQSCWSCLA